MDKRAFDTLKKTVEGHTPGPWFLSQTHFGDIIKRNGMPVLIGGSIRERTADGELAAAAPDLLAEVERLRKHVQLISENAFRGEVIIREFCIDALNGAEVPE